MTWSNLIRKGIMTQRNKFPYYLKYCQRCGELYKAKGKQSKFCKACYKPIGKGMSKDADKSKGQ